MNTEYMEKIGKQLKEKNDLSDASINLYLQQMRTLNGGEPFKNLTFLKDVENVKKIIEAYGTNTQKTYLSAVVAVLSLGKKSRLLDTYKELLDEKIKEYNEKDKNEKTEKENKNWMSWDEIEELKTDLREKVNEFVNNKKITNKQWEILLRLLLVSLYTEIPPRRNQDYQHCYINKDEKGLNDDKNYLITSKDKFIFNKYKTAKSGGKQEIDFSKNDEFSKVLEMYLKHHPLLKGKKSDIPFLVDSNGTHYTATNAITRLLNKAFGKKVGSSMLRKIYLTSKYGDKLETFKEMRELAKSMGHSASTAQNVYIKEV